MITPKWLVTLLTFLTLLLNSSQAAQLLLMTRSPQTFPETMLKLQDTLREHNYTLSRVQRVDIGLTNMGYITDKYRIVFYGKLEENQQAIKQFPQLIPYLPLKIAMFAEGEETLLVASNPMKLSEDDKPEMNKMLKRWEQDLVSILTAMRAE